jgi:iron complex outermembrane recepter protein
MNVSGKKKNSLITWTLTPMALAIASTVWAQTDRVDQVEPIVLEEILIEGLKREKFLQDIPHSVLAFRGDALQSAGIIDLQSLSLTTPGISYAQATGASDLFFIRNLGTAGSGPHFEPGVGLTINDQFISRSRLGRSGFFDIAQVEVFKGPQGAVIGKNTSLGAIVVTPNKPTDEFTGGVNARYEFESREGYLTEGFVSGPITQNMRGRLALSYRDQNQLVENGIGAPDANDEDLSGRVIVDFQPTDSLLLELSSQFAEYDRNGEGRELAFCSDRDAVQDALGDDCRIDGKTSAIGLPAGFNPNTGFGNNDAGTPFDLSANITGFKIKYDFSSFTLTSITGYQDSDIVNTIDSDISARNTRVISNREQFEQVSQEVRLTSNNEGRFNWLAGVFYLDNEMDFEQLTDFSSFFGRDLRRQQLAEVDTKSFSVFGQIDYALTDTLTATFGARFTDENRDGFVLQTNYSPSYSFDNAEASCNVPGPGAGFRVCNQATDKFDSQKTSYNTSLQWQVTTDNMLYVTAATGFKSGGFNLLSGQRQEVLNDTFVFDDEESLNLEVGGKHMWVNNALRFNWSVFNTEVDDLQISQNIPTIVAQVINNAGEVSSTGFEFDGAWRINQAVKMNYAGAWIDTEYDSFQGAGCYTEQTPAQGCVGGVQNLSGERPTRAPEFQFLLGVEYTLYNILPGTDFLVRANANFVDDYQVDVSNDPVSQQDATTKFDLAMTLLDQEGVWEVSIIGRNLSDEKTISFASGTTAVNGPLGGGGRFGVLDETRAIALQFERYFD